MEIHLEETAVSGSFFFCAAAAAMVLEEAATLAADAETTAACGSSFSCAAVAALAETDAANLLEREQLRLFPPAFSKWRSFLLHIRLSFFIYIVTTPRKGGSYGKTSSSTHDSF